MKITGQIVCYLNRTYRVLPTRMSRYSCDQAVDV